MRFLRAWALAWLLAATLLALLIQGITAQGDELLVNGGFDEGTDPWKVWGGELSTSEPGEGRDDSLAGVFTAEDSPKQLHRVSQCVPAGEGGEYEFAAYLARPPTAPMVSVWLNTVWYDQDDCQMGQEVLPRRDLGTLILEEAGTWYRFEAGPFSGELGSRSADLELSLVAPWDGEAVVYLDDFTFHGPRAPSPTPTPTPTLSPMSTLTPTATPKPKATLTPTPSPHSTPRPAQTVSPPGTTPSPSSEGDKPSSPAIRSGLVNGGFEETDGEGNLLAWRKYGGDLTRTGAARMEGRFSAAFSSRTESTKWVFQTVRVEGGKAYDLGGYALKNDPNVQAAYLRLSWYASADGTGQAIGSADSTSRLAEDSPDFGLLTTGPVVAPAGASSAKARLMLDPASAAEATVYFDAISFEQTEMPPPSSEDPPTPTVVPRDEAPLSPTPDLGGDSPPSQAATPPTPSSPAELGAPVTAVPSTSPTPPASSPPGNRTTPSREIGDGDRTLAAEGREVSTDGEFSQERIGHMPPTLYRQRSTSASMQAARQEAADSGGSAAWPVVFGLVALAVALGLGSGVYLWQRREKRARPP